MPRRSTEPTSTDPTEPSPPWGDLSRLGEYIVGQLGADPYQQDLAVQWMAHQLAEYLKTERESTRESERNKAREAATSLIPRLWEVRNHWPHGWPPPEASRLLHLLEPPARPARSRSDDPTPTEPWWSTAPELMELQREELMLWLFGAIVELDLDGIKAATRAAESVHDADDDLTFLGAQIDFRASADRWFAEHAQAGENVARRAHRAQIIERELVKITKKRDDLIRRSLAGARSYRHRPARAKTAGKSQTRRTTTDP